MDVETIALERPGPGAPQLTLHPADDPAAPVFLVVPAMGMRATYYTPLLTALRATGTSAAVVELRGHTERAAPPPGRRHDFGYSDLVADVAAAVATLGERLPGAPVLPLGHSLGGQVSSAFAARHPEAVAGLALVASGSVHWRAWGPRHLVRTQAAAVLARALEYFPGDRLGFAGREARTQMADWARWARTGRPAFGRPRVDHTAAIGELRLPVLAVTVEGDELSPTAATEALLAMFGHAEVTREHLPAAGGRPHVGWVREPAAVVPLLTGWAARATAGA